jgi:hypothetical protein
VGLTAALVLANPDHFGRTGDALWAMLEEVGSLYNSGRPVIHIERYLVTAKAPPVDGIAPERHVVVEPRAMDHLFETTAGRYVRGLLGEHGIASRALLVVIDQELAPPEHWRYVLWRGGPEWGVVSIAAMDPEYWGVDVDDRARVIKQRARAASMCVVGSEMLGLERCRNPRCFLSADVDSVRRLDVMTAIGDEHPDFPRGERIGFAVDDRADPAAPEPLAAREAFTSKGWPAL